MATVRFARSTNIAHDDAQPTTGYKALEALSPNHIQFIKKFFSIRNVTELATIQILAVLLEIPVGRTRDDKMNGILVQIITEIPRISVDQSMRGIKKIRF